MLPCRAAHTHNYVCTNGNDTRKSFATISLRVNVPFLSTACCAYYTVSHVYKTVRAVYLGGLTLRLASSNSGSKGKENKQDRQEIKLQVHGQAQAVRTES